MVEQLTEFLPELHMPADYGSLANHTPLGSQLLGGPDSSMANTIQPEDPVTTVATIAQSPNVYKEKWIDSNPGQFTQMGIIAVSALVYHGWRHRNRR